MAFFLYWLGLCHSCSIHFERLHEHSHTRSLILIHNFSLNFRVGKSFATKDGTWARLTLPDPQHMSREGTGLSRSGSGGASSSGPRDYGATGSSSSSAVMASTDASNFGGFSPTEFISLSESIAANTIFVKQSWQFLEKANRTVGTAKDNQTLRDKV